MNPIIALMQAKSSRGSFKFRGRGRLIRVIFAARSPLGNGEDDSLAWRDELLVGLEDMPPVAHREKGVSASVSQSEKGTEKSSWEEEGEELTERSACSNFGGYKNYGEGGSQLLAKIRGGYQIQEQTV